MSEIETGGPAFPTREKIGEELGYDGIYRDVFGDFDGMTVRDYFAAKAMQGFLADGAQIPVISIAVGAYQMADAMLAARSKP